MSDNFVMLADVDATPEEAGELSERVVNEFRKRGIITGNATADCVYGGVGFRPGPQISNIYKLAEHEGEFWTLKRVALKFVPSEDSTCGRWPRYLRDLIAPNVEARLIHLKTNSASVMHLITGSITRRLNLI